MKRQHSLFLLIDIVKTVFKFLPFAFLYQLMTNGENQFEWSALILPTVLMFFLSLISGYLAWRNTTYELTDTEFRFKRGVLSKKEDVFPYVKIQGVHYNSNRFLEQFKLTTLTIETAGVAFGASAKLFLSRQEAEKIEKKILHHASDETSKEEAKETSDYRLTWKKLLLMGATSNRTFVLFGVIGLFVIQNISHVSSELEQFLGIQIFDDNHLNLIDFLTSISAYIVLLFIFTLLVAWISNILLHVLRYANFKLTRKEDKLHISYGLWKTKNIALETSRIQAITIKENVLAQYLGYCSVTYDSIGFDNKSEKTTPFIIPFIKKKDVYSALKTVLPDYSIEKNLESSPPQALRRFLIRTSIIPIGVGIAIALSFPKLSFLLMISLLFVFLGYRRYTDNGWQLTQGKLVLTNRFVGKKTVIIPRISVQSFDVEQTLFQRKSNLRNVRVAVATDKVFLEYSVKEIDQRVADELNTFIYEREKY